MTKLFSKQSLTAIAISTLFLLTPLGTATLLNSASASANASASPTAAAAPLTQLQANWLYPNGNAAGQDYNPQTLINSSNAQYLGLAWLFPLPAHPTALLTVSGGLGVDTAPLIVNGTIYAIGQDGVVFAINAANGNQIWKQTIPINVNSTAGMGDGAVSLHLHDGEEQFTTATIGSKVSGPTYWVAAPDHAVWAMNAATGAYELNFTFYGTCLASTITNAQPTQVAGSVNAAGNLVPRTGANAIAACGVTEIAGNNPATVYATLSANILIDQSKGTLITSMLSSSSNNGARCFYEQWNLNVSPPTVNWVTYCSPPEPGSNIPVNPNWDAQQVNSMTNAAIFYPGPAYNSGGTIPGTAVVNLKTLSASVLNTTLYNDWGYIQSAHCASEDASGSPGATGAGWGGQWILGTGPSAGMAFVNTGNKGPYTGDCQPGPDLWSSSVLALNTNTGAWVWGFSTAAHDMLDFDCSWWQALGNETVNGATTQVLFKSCKSGYLFELNAATGVLIWAWTPPTSIEYRCQYCYMLNPMNATQMSLPFFNPSLANTLMYPNEWAGFENEPSFSPTLNYIFTASQNVPLIAAYVQYNATNYGHGNGESFIGTESVADNSTIEAVNAGTGAQVWAHYVPTEGYRGGLSNSGNIVFLTFSSGDLLMLNAQTGATLKDYYVGGPLNVVASIGATSSGQMMVIFPITAGIVSWGTGVPGDIVALTLQGVPTAATTTVATTVTATSTATSTASVTTATTVTAAGPTSTATTTATVTATSTSSTGVSSTTIYGVAAVAVIFIIATGYLAMRGRKPAS